MRFISRERHGGVQPVRAAIQDQLALFGEEVKAALAQDPVSEGWQDDDLRMLAHLYVDQMLVTASLFLEALEGPEDARRQVAEDAIRRMRLITLGREHWLD